MGRAREYRAPAIAARVRAQYRDSEMFRRHRRGTAHRLAEVRDRMVRSSETHRRLLKLLRRLRRRLK